MSTRRASLPRGVTLVELLVAVAITGILLAVAMPSMSDFIARQRLDGVVNELQSDLAQIRAQMVSKQGSNMQLRMHIRANPTNTCYVAFWSSGVDDPRCSCDRPPGAACSISSPWAESKVVNVPASHRITISSNTQSGLIFFSPDTNAYAPPNYEVTVTSARLGSLLLSVNSGSALRVCSVGVKITGYPLCEP